MNNYTIGKIKRSLIRDMGDKNLEPEGEMVFDGESHDYLAYINGQEHSARYTATLYPFNDLLNWPSLICVYGLTNEKEQYTYSGQTNRK